MSHFLDVSTQNIRGNKSLISLHFKTAPQPSNYLVLDTDYTNFSVVYFCSNLENEQSKEAFWLLSRSKVLSAEVKEKVEGLVDKYFDKKASVFIVSDQGEKCKDE
jgi:apolipoprotein D and lipocalin family protein